jgi:hypothetical protein
MTFGRVDSMKRRSVGFSKAAVVLAVVLASLPRGVLAQSSPSFQIEQATLNAGGHPADGVVMSSASHTISLDSIGEGAVAVSMASVSFEMDAGFAALYQPPVEVAGSCGAASGPCLTLSRSGPLGAALLNWPFEPSGGGYNLYRDLIGGLSGLGFGACYQQGLITEMAVDADPVPASQGFFYLVAATNRLGEQGTKGFRSNGAQRNGTVCP